MAAAVALLLALALGAPIVLGDDLPSRFLVFAAVVALQLARRSSAGPRPSPGVVLVALPVAAILTALLGSLMQHDRVVGDLLVVVALSASFAARGAPALVARVGALLALPVVMVFVTPVPTGGRGGDLVWYVVFSLLAGTSALVAERLVAGWSRTWALRTSLAAVGRLAHDGDPSLRRAAADLDARIAASASASAAQFRRVLLEIELAARSAPAEIETRLAALRRAAPSVSLGHAPPVSIGRPRRSGGLRPSSTTRIAIHSGLALALALVIAQALYPGHWSWAAVSVLAISSGLRSRGDVVLRGGERLLGALAGTATATVAAPTVHSSRPLAVALIVVLLVAGSAVRATTYAAYAFCVTAALALLYSLYGESGSHLLGERLVENAIGAACVIGVSSLVLPIRTEAVVRRRTADLLAALAELLGSLEQTSSEALVETVRGVGRRRRDLEEALRPLTIRRRAFGLIGREERGGGALGMRALEATDDAGPLVYARLTDTQPTTPGLGPLRQRVGGLRRELAATARSATANG